MDTNNTILRGVLFIKQLLISIIMNTNESLIIRGIYCVAEAWSDQSQSRATCAALVLVAGEGCFSPETEIAFLHEPQILFFVKLSYLYYCHCGNISKTVMITQFICFDYVYVYNLLTIITLNNVIEFID